MTQLYPQYKKQLTTKIVLFSALSLLMMASLPNTYAEQYPDVPVPFKTVRVAKWRTAYMWGWGAPVCRGSVWIQIKPVLGGRKWLISQASLVNRL